MSLQETNLQAIADAIRQKEGTTAPIPASAFAARILDIQTGSDFAIPLIVTVDPGAAVTAVNGDISVTGTAGDSGTVTLTLTAPGVWTVTGTLVDVEKSTTVEVVEGYHAQLNLSSRLPRGYTEVEYIETDGKCGINTGIDVWYNKTHIELEIEPKDFMGKGNEYILYYPTPSGYKIYFDIYRKSNTQLVYLIGAGSVTTTTITKSLPKEKMKVIYDGAKKELTIAGTSYKIATGTGTHLGNPLYIFFSKNSTSAFGLPCKLYSCKISEEDSLQRDFVPCINADGKAGLFDLVEKTFYENVLSGVLTPGPAV